MRLLSCLRSIWDRIVCTWNIVVPVVGLAMLSVIVGLLLQHYWDWFVTGPTGRESGSTTLRNLGLLLGGLVAIGLGTWRSVVASHQADTSQRGLLNERYQKGAEMLGSEVLSVRLGGIYALQRLARDNPQQYYVQIMRLFCAFVQKNAASNGSDDNGRQTATQGARNIRACINALMTPEDVRAIMTVIGGRTDVDIKLERKEKFEPDLSGAELRGVDLSQANLAGVNLSYAVFAPPDLIPLNLSVRETIELPRTDTNLSGADLHGANLFEANLTDANLTGADLSGAIGLTQDQLDCARADPADPPKLDDTYEWNGGQPLKEPLKMLSDL